MEVLLCVAVVVGSPLALGVVFNGVVRRRSYKLLIIARRVLSTTDYELVPVTAADARAVARLDRCPAQAELLAIAFTQVGDRRELYGDASLSAYSSVIRYFVSTNRTMVASFSNRHRTAVIQSWSESDAFTTTVGRPGFFAVPPSHHRHHIQSSKAAGDLVAQHEKWLRFVSAMTTARSSIIRVETTVEEIAARAKSDHVRVVNWRNRYGDDELLRKDLEGLFGADYEKRGGSKLFQALAAKPPTARVRTPASKT